MTDQLDGRAEPVLLTGPQVAARLGIGPHRVWQLTKRLGAGRKVGDRWLYTEADVASMRRRKTAPGPAKGSGGRPKKEA